MKKSISSTSKTYKNVWKEIIGHPGYFVNAQGQVKSARGEVLGKNTGGYRQVCLSSQYGPCWRYVHRLVAKCFLSGHSETKNQVNHKNGNKSDNNVNNLEWVSPKENMKHASTLGLLTKSPETIEKMRVAHLGRKHTMMTRLKMSVAQTLRYMDNKKSTVSC